MAVSKSEIKPVEKNWVANNARAKNAKENKSNFNDLVASFSLNERAAPSRSSRPPLIPLNIDNLAILEIGEYRRFTTSAANMEVHIVAWAAVVVRRTSDDVVTDCRAPIVEHDGSP